MKNLPTTRQLQYLLALEEQQHFGRAAKQCFVSQSAFSIAIRELEKGLQCQLFERTNRSVKTTAAGKNIIDRARKILQDLEDLSDSAAARRDPLQGRLALGVIPTIAPFLLPKLVPKLQRAYPKLELILREEQTATAYESLMAGRLELILIALPYDLPGTTTVALFNDPFHLAYRKGTQWLDESKVEELAQKGRLPDDAVILLEDGHCLRDHALSQCRLKEGKQEAKLSPFSSTSITTLLQMVAQDIGVTYIPAMALDSPILKGQKILTTAMPDSSFRGIGLAWREGSAFGDNYRELAEAITRIAQR